MRIIILFILLHVSLLNAQKNTDLSYYLPQDVVYNSEIPTPESIIGHAVGEWHITHDKLLSYMQTLARVSDRISIDNRGTTFEGRPLPLLTITSKKNHDNIEDIKSNHIAATENNTTDVATRPVIVYQGFSIHGNEPSGSNAALLVAYYLAAAEGNKIDDLLQHTIILFDPCYNPDGLQRFAYWANTNKSKNINPDPNDREYDEVWPGGRTNHYWFDMNRDWLPVQLPESRVRIKSFHEWLPNVLTDHHEMGTNSTFFFQPGVPSRTHPLTPKLNQELTKSIGNYHAKALDKIGSLYYSEENFDDFYYGKGSTFPDINGSIGILFEQGSSRGHAQESVNGILTFPFTIRNQFTTALSTLEASLNMREALLQYQHDFFKTARNEANKDKGRGILFGDSKDAAKTYHLAEILQRHKIDIHKLKNEQTVGGKKFLPEYSFVVPKNQKNARLLKAMFETRTTFKDSLFYDVSAWTFPLAFGLDYQDNISIDIAGDKIESLQMKTGNVSAKSNYAYLMEWHEYYSPRALNKILSSGLRAKVSMKKFTLNNKTYDYGTILIPVQNQVKSPESLFAFLKQVAKDSHVQIDAVSTGLTDGIDLGSSKFRALSKPKVALIVGEGIRSYDAGEIWHLLDQRYNMLVTKLDTKDLSNTDLSRYNTIILPSGSIGKSGTENIKTWTQNGGTLIAFRSALNWLNQNEIVKIEFKSKTNIAKDISFEDKGNFRGAQVVGGAIFEATIDRSHPINFGYKNDKLALFRNNTMFLKPDKQSYNNPIQYTKKPLLSGYISKQNLDSLSLSVPFKAMRYKSGKILAFTDNTNFRAFWYGTNKLMMNAIFFRNEM